ncbi:ATP-binding protein, partial [Nocardia xishanensis]
QRPSAAALGEMIRQAQRHHGFAVDEMALQTEPGPLRREGKLPARGWRAPAAPKVGRRGGHTLPLELTSFVGRRAELAALKDLLASTRLVTLTGIGGVGKTRLALRAASDVREEFADGVWLVELADVPDPSLLIAVVATALGLRDESTRPLSEVVAEFLSGREALLVLDNCEQVVAAVAGLVETWLRDCAGLRVLVTSREPLDIAGETVLRVPPLTVPDPEPSQRGLPSDDAVTLFADRATAVVPGFELSEDNKAAIASICARLDGLPLAIELAAARVRTMSPEQILRRLDDRYALLTRASRTAPARQQTLQWCIDWSYHLCDPVEQWLWARLSVFAGGFELDAAEEICGADMAPEGPLDVLSSLVDKSILIRDESKGVVRFRMLETVREYGRQKLRQVGEYADMRKRHRDWYQQLVLDAEAGWISDRQPYWLARLQREQTNLRDTLEYCLAEDSEQAAEAGLRISAGLFMFWSFRGMYGEARSWIERVLDHPARQPVPDRLKALYAGCVFAAMQGDLQESDALAEQGRVLAEQAPTPMARALIAYCDGALQFYWGGLAKAAACFERAAEGFSSDQQGYLYVSALTVLGWVHEMSGDTKRAMEYHGQVLAITEACGESLFRSSALRDIGIGAWRQGERPRAIELVENALRLNQQMGSPVNAAMSLEALAWMIVEGGEAERAAVLLGAAQGLWRSVGNPASIVPMPRYHDECERLARSALGTYGFDSAFRHGQEMGMDKAVSYAFGEQPADTRPRDDTERRNSRPC